MISHKDLEEAKEIIETAIREGLAGPEDFEGLSDEEFVRAAKKMESKLYEEEA